MTKLRIKKLGSGALSFEYGGGINASSIDETPEVIFEEAMSEDQAEEIIRKSKDYEVFTDRGGKVKLKKKPSNSEKKP